MSNQGCPLSSEVDFSDLPIWTRVGNEERETWDSEPSGRKYGRKVFWTVVVNEIVFTLRNKDIILSDSQS